jgi:hypothetical protein
MAAARLVAVLVHYALGRVALAVGKRRQVMRHARALRRTRHPLGLAMAALLVGLCSDGELRSVAEQLEGLDMAMHAAAAVDANDRGTNALGLLGVAARDGFVNMLAPRMSHRET